MVLAAGYSLRRRNFIKNLGVILGLGIVGTFISMVIFSLLLITASETEVSWLPHEKRLSRLECLILAAVLCATDTVAALSIVKESSFPKLNAILFGEGIVNDAVSILLFETV